MELGTWLDGKWKDAGSGPPRNGGSNREAGGKRENQRKTLFSWGFVRASLQS